MKQLLIIIIAPIFLSISTYSQWVNLNPFPDENDMRSVYFINDNIGWMVGSAGFITKTEDAGQIWQKQESNTNLILRSIHFVNESVGWCVGDGGTILKTNNGGDNWEIQISNTVPGLNEVQFIDENIGWAVGYQGIILKTGNGGIDWQVVDEGVTNQLNSVFFVNQMLGFIVGNGGIILRTTDGGTTWEQNFLSGNLDEVTFVNDSVGWLTGEDQNDVIIRKTTDGGLNWFQIFAASGRSPTAIHFINEDLGSVVAFQTNEHHPGSNIITTTDGGISWIYSGIDQWVIWHLHSIYITDAGIGFAIGNFGMICLTVDGGLTWNFSYSSGAGSITDVAITTKDGINSPIAIGNRHEGQQGYSVAYHPITGTDYWTFSTQFGPEYDSELEFINDSVGFAHYDYGGFHKTTDRGYTWGSTESEKKLINGNTFFPNYSEMFFLDENIGFWQPDVGDGSGRILNKTTNSGSTWEFISSSDLDLRSFHFFDEIFGIATSDDKIYKTTNGGIDWFEIFNQGGREILFTNPSVGFVVGVNGNIFKTTNAGNDWFQVNDTGVTEDLNNLFFINENVGYVVGNNGTVLVTPNTGNSWFQQDLGMNYDLRSVIFLDDNVGYIAAGNALLKTENGGGIIPVELTTFTASTSNGKVTLNWATATETNNQMFEIERKLNNTAWNEIGFVEGHGTTTETQNYQFIDDISNVQAKSLSYRLKQIDYDGSYEYSDVVELTNLAPTDFALQQNYPNPFNPVTTITYSLPVKSQVTLVVYNVLGESVVLLVNEEKEAGRYEVEFNATSLPSGIYFYRIKTGSFFQTKKMALMK